MTNRKPYNLSARTSAYLSYWHFFAPGSGDSALVEVSVNDTTWEVIRSYIGVVELEYQYGYASLENFIGEDSVRFRSRLVTDESGTADGWYIDDVGMLVDTTITDIVEDGNVGLPVAFTLDQNYPNPLNSETTITYDLPPLSHVNFIIYDING